jgi:type I restriction-modification system DNA methylase subunit
MVDRLSNLVGIFANPSLDFSGNRAEGDNLLGDAYEYLMRHFATESGKSNGQFYTPAEVSRVMAKVVGVGSARNANQTIHDPTCGSGSRQANQANRQMAQADHKRRRRVCSKVSDGLLVVCDGRAKVRKESVSLSREHATYP